MSIKTAILLFLIAIAITACISMNESKTEEPQAIAQETVGQQQITKIEPQNETIPPGTVVKEIKSQIKFNIIPPPGMNESMQIGN